ncbi:MAG: ABC transporter permease [Betaproteobacteria bacterium]|jgi:peptide/nickel transport system permease protein|nr:ABC transporter permease [Betaproteobacteria bacterium]
MLAIILKRLLLSVPTLAGIVVVTFALTRLLPGDPAAYFAGNAASVEAVEQIRAKLGLNQPLATQFVRYVKELATGDWGQSLNTGQPVAVEIATRLPASLELTLVALVLSLSVSIPLGVLAATRPGSWVDQLCRLVTTAGVSLPVFFTGLLLSFVFYFLLGWAPSPLGRIDPYVSAPATVTGFYLIDSLLAGSGEAFWSSLRQLILPAITLALFVMAPVARMTRASMLGVLSADFVRTARAMGLSRARVLYGYAFRNAFLPVLTTIGMVFSFMLGANVLVEKVFAWPGIGSFAIESLVASDYAPVQGFVLTMAILYVALNLVIDLLYLAIDPRVSVAG